jgi:hypothetical protein
MWVVFFVASAVAGVSAAVHERVLLRDIQVLTLRAGAFTTGRRNSPIPQVQCQNCGDDAARRVVDTIQCKNAGFDGRDVNWKCETEIDKHWKLGRSEVSCEGFDYPDDPFVLVGSCAVEYHLIHTPPPTPPTQRPTQRPTTQHRDTFFGDSGPYRPPVFRRLEEKVEVQKPHPTGDAALVILLLGTLATFVGAALCCMWCDKHTSTVNHVHIPPSSPAYPSVHVPYTPQQPPVVIPVYTPSPPPPVVVHRTTTVVRERSPSPVYRYEAPEPSAPVREPSPEKHVSASYATTKRR